MLRLLYQFKGLFDISPASWIHPFGAVVVLPLISSIHNGWYITSIIFITYIAASKMYCNVVPTLALHTQVDNFFVPVLHLLSDKLHLPPGIAGMTLLALGNGETQWTTHN